MKKIFFLFLFFINCQIEDSFIPDNYPKPKNDVGCISVFYENDIKYEVYNQSKKLNFEILMSTDGIYLEPILIFNLFETKQGEFYCHGNSISINYQNNNKYFYSNTFEPNCYFSTIKLTNLYWGDFQSFLYYENLECGMDFDCFYNSAINERLEIKGKFSCLIIF